MAESSPPAVNAAFIILTGRQAPERLIAHISGISDPFVIRDRILKDPEVFALVPELRLAYEIGALQAAKKSGMIKLVIGAAGTSFTGWVSTNERLLNLLKPETWKAWLDEDTVDAMLSEHVWEHLTADEGVVAARTCFSFLKPGCRLRIAVPDALLPDPLYHKRCEVGNTDGHKVFYDYKTLTSVLSSVGFVCSLLEWWDENGIFNRSEWSSSDGHIGRSQRFDPRNNEGKLAYTSLIVDAFKPVS